MYTPLSNVDINNYIKEIDARGVNIYELKDVNPHTNIETIFKNRGHTVFFVGPRGDGHWIGCLRNLQKEIYWMDSLGETPSHYERNHLVECFKNNGIKNFSINKKVLQSDDSMVCGRYPLVFIGLHKKGIPPSTMIDFLVDGGKKYGSVDNFILELTKK